MHSISRFFCSLNHSTDLLIDHFCKTLDPLTDRVSAAALLVLETLPPPISNAYIKFEKNLFEHLSWIQIERSPSPQPTRSLEEILYNLNHEFENLIDYLADLLQENLTFNHPHQNLPLNNSLEIGTQATFNTILEQSFHSANEEIDAQRDAAVFKNQNGGIFLADLMKTKIQTLAESKQQEILQQIEESDPEFILEWPKIAIAACISNPNLLLEQNTPYFLHAKLQDLNQLREKNQKILRYLETNDTELMSQWAKEIILESEKMAWELVKDTNCIAAMKIAQEIYMNKTPKNRQQELQALR